MGLQGGTVLNFGIDSPEKSYGLVQSYVISDTVKRDEAKAPDGSIVSIQEYGNVETLDLRYFPLDSAATTPQIGTTFQFNSKNWQVDSISDEQTVDGFASILVIARHYPEIGV